MVFLGVRLLVASFRKRVHELPAVERPGGSVRAAFVRGALTNLLNPKVGVFYVATIPQFLAVGVAPLGMGLLLALVHDAESLIWFAALIYGAHYLRRWLNSPRVERIIDRVTGSILWRSVPSSRPNHDSELTARPAAGQRCLRAVRR